MQVSISRIGAMAVLKAIAARKTQVEYLIASAHTPRDVREGAEIERLALKNVEREVFNAVTTKEREDNRWETEDR
jgi:hypothetical protein